MKKHTVFIGIDVSKSKLDISVVLGMGTKVFYHKVYSNDIKGIKSIVKDLEKQQESGKSEWLFCMEHTGVYTMPMASWLSENGLDYLLVPALEIQRSVGMRRGKSDKTDSADIARYASKNDKELKCYELPEKSIVKLKLLLGLRDRLVSARTIFKSSSKEIGAFMDKKVNKEVLAESRSMITTLDKKIKKIELTIAELIASEESMNYVFKLATSVPGIGPQIAYHLIVCTRCFTGFSSSRKLACYAGVAPFEYSSGSSIRGKTRVSHLADKKLKSLLGMGAVAATRFDKELNLYYQRKVDEGKHKMSVMNAVKNKLLTRVFATIKRGTPYVPLMNHAS